MGPMPDPIYVLGGHQTDFARNWAREGAELFDALRETVEGALADARLDPEAVETAHVGNFTAELFCRQGHLGGLLAAVHPAFSGLPCGRHEGACASGSLAALGASAELEAGRYGVALVVGIEQMRNVPGATAAEYIGAPALWSGHECQDVAFPWPHVFGRLGDEYDARYGLRHEHLAEIARTNFANARRNPSAQTRGWRFEEGSFAADDERNPVIDGRIRKQDCGQITDGAAAVVLASAEAAAAYARARTSRSRPSRASGAGDTAPPPSPSRRSSARAATPPTCSPTSAARSPTPSGARAWPTCGSSTPSRCTTASPPPSTWPSTTSASPRPARAGRPSRPATSRRTAASR